MLKAKLTEEQFNELEENLKPFYEQSEDGFKLKVEGLEQEKQPDNKNDENVEGLKNKVQELLDEAKRAKAAKRETEEELEKIKNQEAKKQGDYEQLYSSSEEKRKELETQYQNLLKEIADKEVDRVAGDISHRVASNPDNAELLMHFVKNRLAHTDDGIRVTDDNGGMTVATIEQLEEEIKNSNKFASLIKGSSATGGSATGSTGSADKTFYDYSESELTEIANSDPARFDEILKTK